MAGAARNLDFMFQALDWLGNDDDIIGIRNRVSPTGRLDRITAKPAKSRAMRAAQVVNVALIPIGLLVFGFFRIYLRKRRR
jgi:ABC-type uncharacterized transport system involved in gliding motility auxiliary subunit